MVAYLGNLEVRRGNWGAVGVIPDGIDEEELENERRLLPKSVAVEVSLNGVDYTKGSLVDFTWYGLDDVVVSSIFPSAGPAAGGTRVTIAGLMFADYGGLAQGPRCQWGEGHGAPTVPATVARYDAMHCD